MQMKTMSGEYDAQAYVYVAEAMKRAGRTAATFTASMDNVIRAVERVTTSIHSFLEAYYFQVEAELKWEDEGGACYDRGE